MHSNPIVFLLCIAVGIGCIGVAFESFKYALTGTSPDPVKAAEEGPKTIGARLAGIFVSLFCSVAVVLAFRTAFLN